MKQLPTEFFSFTEIGGVGEMVYKAVRFPECVPQYDHERKDDTIVPICTYTHPPEAGTDYSITGQELLVSLCNLYKKINTPDYSVGITDMVWDWCRSNIVPYNIEQLCNLMEQGNYMELYLSGEIVSCGTFDVKDFVNDLCKLGSVFEYYDVLTKIRSRHDVASGRALYYEGRICDSKPFLEKFRHCQTDEEYLAEFNAEYENLISDVLEAFPDIKMRLQKNRKTGKIEMGADVQSVFDIAWYTFARLVADVAPPVDEDLNYIESQGSILTCMACGEYFVRHSSRQRYCNNPSCQAERNNRKARAYYQRKKIE
jgi:hypothetical protein